MKKLLKNKKGQIPTTDILSNIINGIRSSVSWFLQTAPKPLLLVLFLMFILLLGNFLMPLMVNSFGYHCDTNYNVWKISGVNLFTNYDILRSKPNVEEADTLEIPFTCGDSGQKAGTKVAICTNCTESNPNAPQQEIYCISDGYAPEVYNSFLERLNCNFYGCAPPDDYYYDYETDKYVCGNANCVNRTLEDYNNKIYETDGAIPVYVDPAKNRSVDNMIYFKCKENNPTNIRVTIYGLDIFDYKIWVALFVLFTLMWVLIKVKHG